MILVWMAWTWQTAVFFGLLVATLVVMTVLAVKYPETPRKGILGFATTRGDRLFVTLLGMAYIFILWIRFAGSDNLWYALIVGLLFGITMFRFA